MSDYAVMPMENWQSIVDSVRAKTGKSDLLVSGDVAAEIESLGEATTIDLYDKPETIGQMACLARARQMKDIKYITKGTFRYNGGAYETGTELEGITYSSVRNTDNFIGFNVSLHTFMTAVNNPKADIYTKNAGMSNGKTWYGVNCTTFVAYCHDWPYHSATDVLPYLPYLEEITDPSQMKLCDIANASKKQGAEEGHAVMITGIKRDEEGNITEVEITEANSIKVASTTMAYTTFVRGHLGTRGYKLYRDNSLYKTVYKATDYVKAFEYEPITEITYSDLCTNLGDKATITTSDSITLNPLVTDGYTSIKVYKNGAEYAMYEVGDITLTGLEEGRYTAVLCPETDNSSTSFIVENVQASRYGTRFYFKGSCIPIRIVIKDSGYYTLAIYDFTEDDIARGYKDIEYTGDDAYYVCVPFKNEYGFVVARFNYADETKPDIPLPAEYQAVTYIETDGNQYIDTGVNASEYSDGITYRMKGRIHGFAKEAGNNYFLGCLSNGSRTGNICANTSLDNFRLMLGGGSSAVGGIAISGNLITSEDFDIFLSCSSESTDVTFTLNGTNVPCPVANITVSDMPDANIYLFECNGITSDHGKFWGKLYSFTMHDAEGNEIRNFIPAIRNTDNVVGLYDTVTGTFFTNAGTGSFIAGPAAA